MTEWDPNISPWTLSYAQDPGCKHESHRLILGSRHLKASILRNKCKNKGNNFKIITDLFLKPRRV